MLYTFIHSSADLVAKYNESNAIECSLFTDSICTRNKYFDYVCGSPKDFDKLYSPFLKDPERIIEAACRGEDGKIYALSKPARHDDVFWLMDCEYGLESPPNHRQGFLTTHGNWVSRRRATTIAIENRQIIVNNKNPDEELYSTDLW